MYAYKRYAYKKKHVSKMFNVIFYHCVPIYFLVSRQSRMRPKDSLLSVRSSVRYGISRYPYISFFWYFLMQLGRA